MVTAPVLLLWPQRGLCGKNYWLAVGASMVGLVFGFLLAILLNKYIHFGFLMYGMFFVLPSIFAFMAVLIFGREGRAIAMPDSVIIRQPSTVFSGFIYAFLVGISVASLLGLFLEIDISYMIMAGAIIFPITLFLSLLKASFLAVSSPAIAVNTSIYISLAVFVASFMLGPYFMVGLPVVLYFLVASFVFLYVIYYKLNKPLKNDAESGAL